ncbi:hypothetical protein TNIN_249381 [Trichonephila inaurata madagascariensis]|uniref:Uncharacterized protein n=1 Tax=Trichonephila inaurata madagascariensis TaxID=2747483 RepID=A0A8X7C3Y5_9ARAC|nr:hypothetical protein TNIN_249381 [Trichonephila inaurata madagascariensis]
MSSTLTTDIRKCWTGFRITAPSFQTPHWTPNFAGNDTSRKYRFYPPSARQIFAFNTFSSTCTVLLTYTEASDEGREDVRGTFRHTLESLYRDTKGVTLASRSIEVDGLRLLARPSDPSLDPNFAGERLGSRKVCVLPSARYSLSNTFSSHFGAANLHTEGFGRGRGCAWDIRTRNPLRDTEGRKPCQKRPLKLVL